MENYRRICNSNDAHDIQVGDICQIEKFGEYDYRVYRNGIHLYTTPADWFRSHWEKMDSEEDKFRELLLNENI